MSKKISLEKLKGVPRTLLLPLRGRYLETRKHNGIIKDPKSVEIFDSVDHDFHKDELPWLGQVMFSIRTEILDQAAKKFLADNPDCVVVNLGCGLDTRSHRLDNGKVLWYDLDLSESIELREKFLPETERFKMIAKSVLDFSWCDDIPKNKKTLFIAEGLFFYFSKEEVKKIIFAIKDNFADSEILFEAYSPLIKLTMLKHKHIRDAIDLFKWMIDKGKSLEKWHREIKFVDQWNYFERHPKRWRWLRFFRHVPAINRTMKIIHLRLSPHLG
jgi:O-methyltransferase involved in polyketide biosynthesis